MTADGHLKVCLGSAEVSLRDVRDGASDDELLGLVGGALGGKRRGTSRDRREREPADDDNWWMTAREKHEWRGLHAARGRSFGADGGGKRLYFCFRLLHSSLVKLICTLCGVCGRPLADAMVKNKYAVHATSHGGISPTRRGRA